MNNLSSFLVSFCSACILLGFLFLLCPKDKLNSSVKYVFCLCFLCCVLSGVVDFPKLNLSQLDTAASNAVLTEQSAAAVAQSVFAEALTQQNINFSKISVDTNKLSNGSITISRVTVYSAESAELIVSVIGSDSYEVCVINE